MNALLDRVRPEALGLSEAERRELVHELIYSLAGEPDAEVEAAWDAEIRRRIREVEEVKVDCNSQEEVIPAAPRLLASRLEE